MSTADARRYHALCSTSFPAPVCFLGNDYREKTQLDRAIDAHLRSLGSMSGDDGRRYRAFFGHGLPVHFLGQPFDDDTDAPFSIALDRRAIDRALNPGHCRLAVWTDAGIQLEMASEIRP